VNRADRISADAIFRSTYAHMRQVQCFSQEFSYIFCISNVDHLVIALNVLYRD